MEQMLNDSRRRRELRGAWGRMMRRAGAAIGTLCLLGASVMIAGCGGGSGGGGGGTVASQTVSGVAATGAPLSGQVTLKDSSATPMQKTTVIANDGSFAVDVGDMTAPFIMKATGTSADGTSTTLFSFATAPGTANINPLSTAAVAAAAGVSDPSPIFDKPDAATMAKIQTALPGTVSALQAQLQPLLTPFDAAGTDPIKSQVPADHSGLDGVFDNVTVALANGNITVTNTATGAMIFQARVSDVQHGNFSGDDSDMPKPGPRPAAPTGVTATAGAGQVTVSWNAVTGATSYNLYWSTKTDDGDSELDDAHVIRNATSPQVVTGLTANTKYFFMVRAVNKVVRSAPSAIVSATTNTTTPPPATVPSAPTGVTATGGTKQATISWSAVTGATSYNLYWSTTTGVTPANGTKIAGATSPTVQTGLNDNTTYFYVVTAVNSAGESAASVQVAATTLTSTAPPPTVPAAPTGVSGTGGAQQVTVSWTAVTGATSYNLYYSTTTGVTTANGTKVSGVTSPFVQTGLTDSTTYFFIVTAVNSAGESSPSAQASATTTTPTPTPTAPSAPTGVTATGGTQQVSVSWSAVTGATSYNLYWSTTTGVTPANGTKVTGATSPAVVSGLADNTAYFFVVTAVNAAGESAPSAQATATTAAAAAINGATLYLAAGSCVGCHGGSIDPANPAHVIGSDKQGATAAMITTGIAGVSSMNSRFNATTGTVFKLTPDQINAIAAALQ